MQNSLYRDIILDHWQHPQNYGVLNDADIDVTENNPLCGDEIRLMMKLKDNKIAEMKFIAEGCAISKASASLFTEEVKGKKLQEVKNIKPQEMLDILVVNLTPTRTKCALLIYQAVQSALQDTK